ncbi:hypothetical protein FQA47_000413 [Oryzias melastigma]|uniref:Uncharacterized protein n=1 Tax=Oryzias melastigma TaxID=30732 RepID=A0A834CGG4_ORYME|nr:hypothetical protein FQA47_000413 [Oryzias melastigma]
MGCYGVFSKFSRRGKFFALLIFSLMVVAWIATYSGDTVKRTAALPTLTQNALIKYKLKENFEALTSSPSDLNAAHETSMPRYVSITQRICEPDLPSSETEGR